MIELFFFPLQTLPTVFDQAATPPSDLVPPFSGPNQVRSAMSLQYHTLSYLSIINSLGLHVYYIERPIYPVCVTPQSQQPLGNLDAELRRALSPETVQGGNRVQPPEAGFTLGSFRVGFQSQLKSC